MHEQTFELKKTNINGPSPYNSNIISLIFSDDMSRFKLIPINAPQWCQVTMRRSVEPKKIGSLSQVLNIVLLATRTALVSYPPIF
jgi:hypothetical protein